MAERRWPDLNTVMEKARKGIIDDTMAAVPPYDLEDWEILGLPPPDETAPAAQEHPTPKRSRRRRERR